MITTRLSNDVAIIHNSDFSGETIIKSNEGEVSFNMESMAAFIIEEMLEGDNINFFNAVLLLSGVRSITIEKVTGDNETGPVVQTTVIV